MVTQALPSIQRMARRRPAKLACLLLSLGLSFGFVAVVAAVVHASWFRLPAGVAHRDYVSLGRETADYILVSNNQRHFSRIDSLKNENWM